MNVQSAYLLIALIILLLLALYFLVVARSRRRRFLSPSASLAFAFVVAGIIFGEERWLGYSLIGAGILMAVWDILRTGRRAP